MLTSDDSDGMQDGTFTLTIANGLCAGRTLSIPQGTEAVGANESLVEHGALKRQKLL